MCRLNEIFKDLGMVVCLHADQEHSRQFLRCDVDPHSYFEKEHDT